jgi:hypothetical protein
VNSPVGQGQIDGTAGSRTSQSRQFRAA